MGPSEYRPYDQLPIAAIVLRGEQVVYANPPAAELHLTTLQELVGISRRELARRVLPEADRAWAEALGDAAQRGEPTPDEVWLQLCAPGAPERSVQVLRVPAPVDGDTFLLLLPFEAETANRRLTETLVTTAARFVRCREEQEVLDLAVNALFQLGYLVTIMEWVDGDLVVRAMRQNPDMLAKGTELYGVPAEQVRFDPKKVPHFERMFATGRAMFVQEPFALMDLVHRPDVAKMIREVMPANMRLVDTPIFVEGRPFGVMDVCSLHLTPSSAGSIELFGQLVGSALENVRHHRQNRERVRELTQLQQELVSRERLAAVGEAAGVLSHEARNPLGAILNALAVLRRNPGLGPEGHEVLEIAEEESLRLDALVRDLLELARPLEVRARPVSVDGVLDAVLSDLSRKRLRSAANIRVQVASALPVALGDATLLRLAMENLVRNALQAGGGGPIEVSAGLEDGRVVVAVKHSAPARAPAQSGAAFDPFSVAHAGGTGLGLAVVKRVIEAQQGQVRARDGARWLEVLLPIAGDPRD